MAFNSVSYLVLGNIADYGPGHGGQRPRCQSELQVGDVLQSLSALLHP